MTLHVQFLRLFLRLVTWKTRQGQMLVSSLFTCKTYFYSRQLNSITPVNIRFFSGLANYRSKKSWKFSYFKMVTQILFIYVLGVSSMPVIETSLLSGSSTRAMMVSDTRTPLTGTSLVRGSSTRAIMVSDTRTPLTGTSLVIGSSTGAIMVSDTRTPLTGTSSYRFKHQGHNGQWHSDSINWDLPSERFKHQGNDGQWHSTPTTGTSLVSGSSTRAMIVSDTKTPTTGTHLSRTLAYRTIVAGFFFLSFVTNKN